MLSQHHIENVTYIFLLVFPLFFVAIELRVNLVNLFRLPFRDEIMIHRLRIGHTYLTHGHVLRGGGRLHFGA